MNVNEVLERFRKTEYHYPDVIWHDIRSIKLKPKLTSQLVSISANEFKSLLLSNLFLPKTVSDQVANVIVLGNDFNETKLKLFDLFLGTGDFKQRLQNVLDLEDFNPCIASQLLSAVNNKEYTIYHENVVNGIEDFLAHVVDWQLIELRSKPPNTTSTLMSSVNQSKTTLASAASENSTNSSGMATVQAGTS